MKRALPFLLASALALPAARAQDLPEGHVPIPPEGAPEGAPSADPHGSPHTGADPHAGVPGMDPGGDPHGAGPAAHGGMDLESLFRPPDVARAESAPDVPAGTVIVDVQDENGVPVSGAAVELGTMAGGTARERQRSTTAEDGTTTYTELTAGSGHAYRVYVMHEGARYASEPFVLMPGNGHRVHIRRLPVTHDARQLLQFVAQCVVEIRDDRLHVVVQAQLVNAGRDTYVFPEGGTQMHLPEGFIAFNSPAAMNEISITEVAGHGVAFRGSLPPGLVTTAFSFDVPFSTGLGFGESNDVEISVGNPFRTMRYRVIVDAPEGLSLDAEGMPRPQRFESDGHSMLGTELMRRPGDPPLEEIRFTLRGLPGPGPTRWIAVAGGLLLLALGARSAFRERDGALEREEMLAALTQRESELLADAARLRADRDSGEIGPETCQSALDRIVEELASVLAKKDKLGAARPASSPLGLRGKPADETDKKMEPSVAAAGAPGMKGRAATGRGKASKGASRRNRDEA